MTTKIEIHDESNGVERIYRNGAYYGKVIKINKDEWKYVNVIGREGVVDTRYAAFIHLGFKL